MPQVVVEWIGAELLLEADLEIGATILANAATIATVLQVAASAYYMRSQQQKAEKRARDSYNASLKDRYVMIRGATEPRQLVMGRQRVSGPVGFIHSYGTNQSTLVFTVLLAAHEIDAIEDIYFDDEPVVLDGSGNITAIRRSEQFSISATTATVNISGNAVAGSVTATATYGSTVTTLTVTGVTGTSVSVSGASGIATGTLTVRYYPDPNPYAVPASPAWQRGAGENFTIITGSDTFTLAHTPDAGTVTAVDSVGSGESLVTTPLSISGSGTSWTISGGTPGDTCVISYTVTTTSYRARVRKYLGAAGQTADATMISNLGGVWTSAHTGTGLAYLVVELDFDPTAFSGGVPNVSAVVRGAKLYDPRSSATAWSENPALMARWYALHAFGGRLTSGQIDDAAVNAAANICDASTAYSVAGNTLTRALYTAGYTCKADARPQDVLTDLCQAMGGRWMFADGALRVHAGAYTSSVLSIDESWLHDGSAVTVQPRRNRAELINTMVGKFADEANGWREADYPKVQPGTYVADDGRELPHSQNFPAVTNAAQVQYLAACEIRRGRFGITLKMACNMRAFQAEVFDVVAVTLSRFGWSSKPFEVIDTAWTLTGGIELTLQEIDSTVWTLGTQVATPINPPSRLPNAWSLPQLAGLAVASSSATSLRQPDGTVIPRIKVTWTAPTDARVTQQGQVEVQWKAVGDANWLSTTVPGDAGQAYLPGVKTGNVYQVQARTVGAVGFGQWTAIAVHQAGSGATLLPTASIAVGAVNAPSGVTVAGPVSLTTAINASPAAGSQQLASFSKTVSGSAAGVEVDGQASLSPILNSTPAGIATMALVLYRDATELARSYVALANSTTQYHSASVGTVIDVPAAGTYTYSLKAEWAIPGAVGPHDGSAQSISISAGDRKV